jgi:hypothetical protein
MNEPTPIFRAKVIRLLRAIDKAHSDAELVQQQRLARLERIRTHVNALPEADLIRAAIKEQRV